MSDTATTPVYKTGSSLGSILNEQPPVSTPETQVPPEVPATPIAEAPATPPVAATPSTPETPSVTTSETPVVPTVEENVSNFNFGDFEEAPPSTPPVEETPVAGSAPVQRDWKELIKGIDRKELLKEAGISDFAIEIDEYTKKGGQAVDYLNAKAVDWNTVSDADIVKTDLKKQFPNLTSNEVERLFNKKYGVSAEADEDDKADAELLLKTDAYSKRQTRIAEQANFKIPETVNPVVTENSQQQQQAILEQQKRIEETLRFYADHEATKNLMTSKRVALNLGENGNFNFSVERPELLTKAITDASVWQKLTTTKQGEPDVAKLQKIALYAFNPEQFEADLVNYGKSLGVKTLVEEGQNLQGGKIRQLPPNNLNETEADAWKKARSGTIGGK
jgi:hypothetical protein